MSRPCEMREAEYEPTVRVGRPSMSRPCEKRGAEYEPTRARHEGDFLLLIWCETCESDSVWCRE